MGFLFPLKSSVAWPLPLEISLTERNYWTFNVKVNIEYAKKSETVCELNSSKI